jgi:hypothetical protein
MCLSRLLALLSCLTVAACTTPAATTSAADPLTLDNNSSARVSGAFSDAGQTLRFDFAHADGCYVATYATAAGQPLMRATSCSDGDVIDVG